MAEKKYNKQPKANLRRETARKRLENQLKLKMKMSRITEGGTLKVIEVPLDEKDIKRIEKELSILKSRIISVS